MKKHQKIKQKQQYSRKTCSYLPLTIASGYTKVKKMATTRD